MIAELRRIARRAACMIGRGRVKLVDDTGNVQLVQLRLNSIEVLDKVRRLAEFGFSSSPPNDADAIALFIAGDRSNGVIIATGDQTTRFKNLAQGETVIYDAFGKSIWLTKNGGIVIAANGADITVNNAGTVTLNCTKLQVNGDIVATGEITAKNTHTVSAHTHTDPQGGNTGTPTG